MLGNHEDYHGTMALTYHILDRYLEPPATDWIAALRGAVEQEKARAD